MRNRPCGAPLGGKEKLAPYRAFHNELIAQDPANTFFELRDALSDAEGAQVHRALAAYVREVLVSEIAPGTVVILASHLIVAQ